MLNVISIDLITEMEQLRIRVHTMVLISTSTSVSVDPLLTATSSSARSTVTNFGVRSFAVVGPKAWNQLPSHIRAVSHIRAIQ